MQARKDAASRLECLHVQAAVMRSAGPESFLMLHTKCSRCPKPNTSRRRAGCIIAAANGQTTRGSPRRRLPVVERISAQVKIRRVDTGADRREVEKGSTSENGKPSGLGKTAAHGKHMDEKRSRDVHWKEEESYLSRKDRKH